MRNETGRRSIVLATVTLAVATAVATAAGAVPYGHRDRGKLSPRVRQLAVLRPGTPVNVIIRFREAPGNAERRLVSGHGGRMGRALRASRFMVAQLPPEALENLAGDPAVEYVATDAEIGPAMDVARRAASEPPAEAPESSFKGAGVTIALVDTGVAPHPEISTLLLAVDCRNGQPCQAASPSTSVDPNGHGTHVAGILVGDGSRSAGKLAGIAPEAGLVSIRALESDGRGRTSDVLAGLHWVLQHKDQYGIRVLNLSLGHPVYEPPEQDPLVQEVDLLSDSGVVVVCSAGNNGRAGDGTISSPCNSRKVVTVGALNDHDTVDTADETVASFSSRGPTRFTLAAKPDILAPGNRIVSLRSPGSSLDLQLPEQRVSADPAHPEWVEHFEMSGTSMAAPMVAATAALMLQQTPWLSPPTVKARLLLTARKASVGNPFATGAGALDITAALRATDAGQVGQALSPLVFVDPASGRLGFENTGQLWGNPAFSCQALWSPSIEWSAGTQPWDAVQWSDGVLWLDPAVWPYSEMWPDSELWPESELWPDVALWEQPLMWPGDPGAPPLDLESLSVVTPDP